VRVLAHATGPVVDDCNPFFIAEIVHAGCVFVEDE
jgi:hypothetical protein